MTALLLWAAYLVVILHLTLLSRSAQTTHQYNLKLFWSYKRFLIDQKEQILKNIALFVPFGILMPFFVGDSRLQKFVVTIFSAFLMSVSIGFFQYMLKLGLPEFDDVFNNTLGAVIGVMLILIISSLVRKRNET